MLQVMDRDNMKIGGEEVVQMNDTEVSEVIVP